MSKAFREMTRVSSKYVLVAEPNTLNPVQLAFSYIDSEHAATRRFTLGFLRRKAEGAGLRVKAAWSGGWIFPNKTPEWLLPFLRLWPYRFPLGITNWILAEK